MKTHKPKPKAKVVAKQAASKTNPAPIIGKIKKPVHERFVIETEDTVVSIRGNTKAIQCLDDSPFQKPAVKKALAPQTTQESTPQLDKAKLTKEFSSIASLAAKQI